MARVESGRRTVRLGEATAVAEILGLNVANLTASTRETALLQLLGNPIAKAGEAFGEIADSTEALLHAQHQLRPSIKEAERVGYRDSAAVRQAADDGADVLQWTAEQVVALGRRAFRGVVYPEAGDAEIPVAEATPAAAMRAAVTLYGQAAVTAVTPKTLAHITQGMASDMVDEVIAAVAGVAQDEKNGTVLRHIRQAGLERLAAEWLAAEWTRRAAMSAPQEELDRYMSDVFMSLAPSDRESARQQFLNYIEGGGTSMIVLTSMLAAKMPLENLLTFVPLIDKSLGDVAASGQHTAGIRETRPQPVLPVADDKAGA